MHNVEQPAWLTGAPNARDLGGLPTVDGREIRHGALFRAPALGRLTDDDVARLAEVKLIEVIDLRYGQEIVDSPPNRLPAGPHVAHVPIFDPDHQAFAFTSAILLGQAVADGAPLRPAESMEAVYRWFTTAPGARAGFGKALHRILAARGRPVLYHCSAGKDRTGWLSALVLSAAGVDRDTITADYLRTNQDMAPIVAKLVASAQAKRGVDPQLVRPVLAAAPEYLAAAFAQVETDFGSVDTYLREALDVADDERAQWRATVLA